MKRGYQANVIDSKMSKVIFFSRERSLGNNSVKGIPFVVIP